MTESIGVGAYMHGVSSEDMALVLHDDKPVQLLILITTC